MNNKWTARIALCLAVLGFSLYGHIEKQNQITALRIELPDTVRQLKGIQEDNTRLHYEIEQFESPENLIELARHQEFSHMRHPLLKEVVSMPEGIAVQLSPREENPASSRRLLPLTVAKGAH